MSVTYGFYNSIKGDRKYNALEMSSIFDGIIVDGVYMSIGDALNVKSSGGMGITVGIGRAWFNHTWTLNDSLLPLTLANSDVLLNRIDAIVLEVNNNTEVRKNTIKILKGTPSSKPVKPTMTEGELLNQHPLAYISIPAGATSISQSNIENAVGTSACPYVTGVLKGMDIDKLVAQWGAQWAEWLSSNTDAWKAFMSDNTNEWKSFMAKNKNEWSALINGNTSEFETWFEHMKDQLSEDAAGNLQLQVDNLNNAALGGDFVLKGSPVSVEYMGANRIASITAYGENAQGGTTEAPVALTGISSITVNDDVTELPIPRPLRRVGDVRDVCRTRVKSVYDKRVVLDGSSDEVFIQTNIIDGWIQIATESDAVIPESTSIVGSIKSSYLKAYAIEEVYSKKHSGISVDSNRRIRLSFKTSEYPDVTSVETARTYLSAHPLTVYYQSTAYDGTNGLDVCLTEYQTDYIESYADESITTAWISSTGELSTGAEVAYVLSSPETYATEPLDFDNAAGPLTVMTGGEVEVRMTELVGSRTYDADGDGVVDKAAAVPWDGVTGKPGTFAPSAHTHDDRYYTETEMNTKLNGKADSGHTHTSIRMYNSDWSGTDGSITPVYANANKDYVNLSAGNDAGNKWPHVSCQRINGHALNMSLSGTTLSITW